MVGEPGELALEIDSGLCITRSADPHALFDAQPLQLWHESAPEGFGAVALN